MTGIIRIYRFILYKYQNGNNIERNGGNAEKDMHNTIADAVVERKEYQSHACVYQSADSIYGNCKHFHML